MHWYLLILQCISFIVALNTVASRQMMVFCAIKLPCSVQGIQGMSCKRLDGLDSRAGLDVVERSSLAGNKTPVVHPVTWPL
jgi:hypothetical protein